MSSRSYAALLMALGLSFAAAMTPAGTVIRGQAVAVVAGERYLSNEVESVVAAVCGVSVRPNGSVANPGNTAGLLPHGYAYLPYQISNTGNDSVTYPLSSVNQGESDWLPLESLFHEDRNGNGRIDASEPPIAEIELAPGESAHLVLALQAPGNASGSAFVAPAAACPDGSSDSDNVSMLRTEPGPVLSLETFATPDQALPGELVTFSTTVQNIGGLAAHDAITISDLFDEEELADLSYVSGSAAATSGSLEYRDGESWAGSDSGQASGVRLNLPGLAQGQRARLDFVMRVAADAQVGLRTNRVEAQGPGGPARVTAALDVLALRVHHFGPVENPDAWPGGEGSEFDRQIITFLRVDQTSCLDLSITNPGTGQDSFLLENGPLPEGVIGSYRTVVGTPLQQPVPLEASERIEFSFCLTATNEARNQISTSTGAVVTDMLVDLYATSLNSGETNSTTIQVGPLELGADAVLSLSASPAGLLDLNTRVSYSLRVVNESSGSLTDTVVRFPIPRFTPEAGFEPAYLSSTGGGSLDASGRTVRWSIGEMAAGEEFTAEVELLMPKEPVENRGFVLPAAFSLISAELTNPRESNRLVHTFPAHSLLVESAASPARARVGEVVRHDITVINPTRQAVRVQIASELPAAVQYRPGSGVVSRNGERLAIEPALTPQVAGEPAEVAVTGAAGAPLAQSAGRSLYWDLRSTPELVLAPVGAAGASLTLSYETVLTPGVAGDLLHVTTTLGEADVSGFVSVLADSVASTAVEVVADAFHLPTGLLTGRVFLDQDGDGSFDSNVDSPIAGARLVLANGWQTITDAAGLYAFNELREGSWALLLDAKTAPFPPLAVPGTAARPYQRHIRVQGLTVADFALRAPRGNASATRSTTLVFGPMTVAKQIIPEADDSRVVLTISSSEPVVELIVVDPLPGGGEQRFEFERFEGSEAVEYRLPLGTELTDPDVRWKDPYR